MMGYPTIRGRNKWKLIGTVGLKDELRIVPDFKYCPSNGLKAIEDEGKVDGWRFIRNLYPNNSYHNKIRYENVKHLRTWGLFNQKAIQIELTMEWMKKLDLEIDSYFKQELTDPMEAHWVEVFSCRVRQLPFYEDTALKYRGRAIEN